MIAGASEEQQLRRRVRFIGFEVEEDSDGKYGDESGEVDVQVMRLRSIGLPEEIRIVVS